VLGGVCGGIARRFGLPVRVVRVIAIVSVVPFALGLVAYMACWALVPRMGEERSIAARVVSDRRQLQIVLAVGTVALAVLVTLQVLGLQGTGDFEWPLMLSAIGALCVWRGVSDDERTGLQERIDGAPLVSVATSTGWRMLVLRVFLGAGFVLLGVWSVSKAGTLRGAALDVFLGTTSVAAGFLVLFAPWWLRTLRDLTRERRQRVRAQERADVAAHLHDSVLQTLLLIQKAAHDPAEVVRIARKQERELRHWLFDPAASANRGADATLSAAAAEIERDVEDAYGVGVELIVVGDCALDESLRALLAAGREATVNAAKWSAAPSISVFCEVEDDQVSIYVRDVGRGFDPEQVPSDRKGIACSIRERMTRHGGSATLRSTVGAGTEVELILPRTVGR
jgi:signal transduction histidine kinase